MATFFTSEEIKELKSSVPFDSVCNYFGIPIKKHGASRSILCPFHGDRHYGSCLIRKKGAFCFVCNKQITATELAMSQGLTFYQTMNLFAHLLNRTSDFEQKGKKEIKNSSNTPIRPKYTMEDMDFIGLRSFVEEVVESYSFKEPSLENKNRYDYIKIDLIDGGVAWGKLITSGNPLKELEKSDPEAFNFLVHSKIKEVMGKAIEVAQKLKNMNSEHSIFLKHLGISSDETINGAKNIYEEAEKLLIHMGGEVPSPKELVISLKRVS